ncbi:hypothetical protein M514_11622 [Trichuris suis]|uniref:Peptidase A2 domain-containing protein n=1 Tax=Trichuris suis TaxID=68888 RepID=A0A085N388_9BILA|nr:hypothetical protein M513_11622 [Trichuris suis]KFD63934.1 hypothetical protein M514_11622 [Trichuris suis]KHJ42505.1 hypothetical protein D918_07427 [Trichuris suis]
MVGNKAVVPVRLNCYEMEMIYDPGATRSVVSENMWQKIGKPPLEAAPALIACTKVPVETMGKAKVKVSAFGRTRCLYVHVVKEHDGPLFGLNWCKAFGLRFPKGIQIRSIHSLSLKEGKPSSRHDKIAQALTEQYPEVFANDAGTLVGYEAVVHLKKEAQLKVFKPRPAPFFLKPQVDEELNRLLEEDVLEQVDSVTMPIEWASPIVGVVKTDGKV